MSDDKTQSKQGLMTDRPILEGQIVPSSAGVLVPKERWNTADFEMWLKFRKDVLKLLAAEIRPGDITMFGDNPHYGERACKMIMNAVGADFDFVRDISGRPIVETVTWGKEEDQYVEFVVYAKVIAGGKERTIIGTRASNDDFFAKRWRNTCTQVDCERVLQTTFDTKGNKVPNTCPVHGPQEKYARSAYYLPLSEISVRDVRQAAITNAWNKACGALGLLPSLEDLEEAGFNVSSLRSVDFKGSPADEPEEVKAQRTKAFKLLMTVAGGDEKKSAEILKKLTTFQGNTGLVEGKTSVGALSIKQLPRVIADLEKLSKAVEKLGGKVTKVGEPDAGKQAPATAQPQPAAAAPAPATAAAAPRTEQKAATPPKGSQKAPEPTSAKPAEAAATPSPQKPQPAHKEPAQPSTAWSTISRQEGGSWKIKGMILGVIKATTSKDQPYSRIDVPGTGEYPQDADKPIKLYCYKDHVASYEKDGKMEESKIIDLLATTKPDPANPQKQISVWLGQPFEALCITNQKGYHSVERVLRLGEHEWEPDGTPVRQVDHGYQATDEDLPPEFSKPKAEVEEF